MEENPYADCMLMAYEDRPPSYRIAGLFIAGFVVTALLGAFESGWFVWSAGVTTLLWFGVFVNCTPAPVRLGEFHDEGETFRVEIGGETRTIRLADVTSIALVEDRLPRRYGVVCRMRMHLELGDAGPPILIQTDYGRGNMGRIGAIMLVFFRIQERLAAETMAGRPLYGGGWTLSGGVLTLHQAAGDRSYPLAELEVARRFGASLYIWQRRPQGERRLEIPQAGANVPVLERLIRELHPPSSAARGADRRDPLGPLLGRFQPPRAEWISFFAIMSVLQVLALTSPFEWPLFPLFALAMTGWTYLRMTIMRLDIHRDGFILRGVWREYAVRIDECDDFISTATGYVLRSRSHRFPILFHIGAFPEAVEIDDLIARIEDAVEAAKGEYSI